jgi:hypothetical protein
MFARPAQYEMSQAGETEVAVGVLGSKSQGMMETDTENLVVTAPVAEPL